MNPDEAVELIARALIEMFAHSQIDCIYHKAWSIDQIARILTGDKYGAFVTEYQGDSDEDAEVEYAWDEGVGP